MKRVTWNAGELNGKLQFAIRIMVASYFLAVGMGFVPGTGLQGLTGILLPDASANLLASVITLVIAAMILLGRWVMVSAMCLSVLLFISSYAAMIQIGVVDELGQFWRDIALIGALLLAHALPRPQTTPDPVRIFSKPGPTQGVVGEMVPAELRLTARHSLSVWRSTRHQPALPPFDERDEIINIFAKGV